MRHEQSNIQNMLEHIEKQFYQNTHPKKFHQNKRMLIYTLTWPATWLEQRALHISQQKYEHIIKHITHQIIKHGKPHTYQKYFPRYLLKCIQQYFAQNEDKLCHELRHIKNNIWKADQIIKAIKQHPNTNQTHSHIKAMATAHCILKKQIKQKQNNDHRQLKLL